MKRVAAIVVTYNRRELLQENIESLLAQIPEVPDILIIDNNSTDGTRDMLESYIADNKIHYYNTGANLGGAGGFQRGIKLAAEFGYKYIWVMDDDCMPTKTALKEFMVADEKLKGNYGFLSSKVLWKDGSICKMNVQRNPLTRNITDFSEELLSATLASFVSLFFKGEVVFELGLPIKEFFIWTDDWEYTRRISRRYPCYVVTRSVAIHKSAQNIGAKIENDLPDRLDRYRMLYRNDAYLYRKEGIGGFLYEVVRLSGHTIKVLVRAKDNKGKRIRMIWAGTKEGLKFNPRIEYPERGN